MKFLNDEELTPADIMITGKPTYYFNSDGDPVSYQIHAQFIVDNSFAMFDGGHLWWCYPMLDFRDMETHYEIHLVVTRYERKIDGFVLFLESINETL